MLVLKPIPMLGLFSRFYCIYYWSAILKVSTETSTRTNPSLELPGKFPNLKQRVISAGKKCTTQDLKRDLLIITNPTIVFDKHIKSKNNCQGILYIYIYI